MYFPRKLKQDINITGFIPAMICLMIGALVWILIGEKEGLISVSVFFVLYAMFSFWIYIRTVNISYLAASLWQLLFGFYLATHPRYHLIPINNSKITAFITVFLLASTAWLFYLVFSKRAKWKGREVFELASISTEPSPDGFTERPRPAGRTDYSKDELIGFAKFLSSNLIAMPYFEENRIVFVPVKMDDEFMRAVKEDKPYVQQFPINSPNPKYIKEINAITFKHAAHRVVIFDPRPQQKESKFLNSKMLSNECIAHEIRQAEATGLFPEKALESHGLTLAGPPDTLPSN